MNRTAAQTAKIRKLAQAYTKACNSGTGAQAKVAEQRLFSYLDRVTAGQA